MRRIDYNKITFGRLSKLENVIAETNNFGISKSPSRTLNSFYPQISEITIFVFCLRGKAKLRINLIEYTVEKNSLVIIMSNSLVQVVEESIDLELDFIFFTFDYISDIKFHKEIAGIVKEVEKMPCLRLEDNEYAAFAQLHDMITEQYKRPSLYRDDIVKNLFNVINYEVLRLYRVNEDRPKSLETSRQDDIYKTFMRLLFANYKTERSVQFYADKMFISPKYFSRVVNEVSGKSAMDWINDMVITAAKAMIKGSSINIAQISDELNFANPSFFGTYFKKATGLNPIKYRSWQAG